MKQLEEEIEEALKPIWNIDPEDPDVAYYTIMEGIENLFSQQRQKVIEEIRSGVEKLIPEDDFGKDRERLSADDVLALLDKLEGKER